MTYMNKTVMTNNKAARGTFCCWIRRRKDKFVKLSLCDAVLKWKSRDLHAIGLPTHLDSWRDCRSSNSITDVPAAKCQVYTLIYISIMFQDICRHIVKRNLRVKNMLLLQLSPALWNRFTIRTRITCIEDGDGNKFGSWNPWRIELTFVWTYSGWMTSDERIYGMGNIPRITHHRLVK
jgi:hypothetical protein